jgi:hypothetical protein
MRTSIFMMLASLAAAPVAAASSENDVKPIHHLDRAIHHRTLVTRAEALVPATIFPGRGPPYAVNYHETDGLSRNPDDCLKYGCIDNGGN